MVKQLAEEPRVVLPEDEQFPRYVRLYVAHATAVGMGYREVVIFERRGRRYRLLDPYYCRAFWLPAYAVLLPGRVQAELPLHGLAARIRRNRRDRSQMNMPFSAPATRQVLEMLRGGNRPTTEEQQDDAVNDRDVDDEADTAENGDEAMRLDDDTAQPGAGEAAQGAEAGAATSAPAETGKGKRAAKAKTAKAKTKGAAGASVQADPRISGKPITNGSTAGQAAKGKGKAAAKAKAAPKARAEGTKAAANKTGYGVATEESVITLNTQENTFKGVRGTLFGLMRTGMTVGQYTKAAEKKGITALVARHGLRSFRNASVLDYTTKAAE